MNKHPSITVIMPVFNSGEYVKEAIQSILDQSYSDFEFIIINDASTDDSLGTIKSFSDKRIIILSNTSNIGNYPSRNRGLRIAKGKYICVMDADDTALQNRLERQFQFMEANPEIGLAGSGFRYFGQGQDIFRENVFEKIKVCLLRNNCFIHPTLIMRLEFLKKYNLRYNEKYCYSADYDFIVRAVNFFPVTNMTEILLNYRLHENQITLKKRHQQMEYADEIAIDQLRNIGVDHDDVEKRLHTHLLKGISIDYSQKQALYNWIGRIISANQNSKYYSENELELFFISLLSMQSFCNISTKLNFETTLTKADCRYDLMDVTFLIHLRIDSQQRIENTDIVLRYLTRHFKTVISILEVDKEQRYFPKNISKNVRYKFLKDNNELFHITHWTNLMISMSNTPYVAIWDADAISAPLQVIDAVNKLRSGEAVMSYPYDGRFFSCDKIVSNIFKCTDQIDVLKNHLPTMNLMHGYHSSGGAFMVNKDQYLRAGGENENIFGWGLEDAERIKRMEMLGFTTWHSSGVLFHLWHPKGKNSCFASCENEIRNRKEFLKICSSTN